jgi:hypothetical protein
MSGDLLGCLIPILFERDSSRSVPRNGAGAHSRFGHKAMIGSDHRVLVLDLSWIDLDRFRGLVVLFSWSSLADPVAVAPNHLVIPAQAGIHVSVQA